MIELGLGVLFCRMAALWLWIGGVQTLAMGVYAAGGIAMFWLGSSAPGETSLIAWLLTVAPELVVRVGVGWWLWASAPRVAARMVSRPVSGGATVWLSTKAAASLGILLMGAWLAVYGFSALAADVMILSREWAGQPSDAVLRSRWMANTLAAMIRGMIGVVLCARADRVGGWLVRGWRDDEAA
jgi:hypothetical protein